MALIKEKIIAVSFSYAPNSMNLRGLKLMDHWLVFDSIYGMLDFNIPMCNVNKSDGVVPQSIHDFDKVLRDADKIIFAIPEATGHYNSGFKNAMDWLICLSKMNSDLAVDSAMFNKPVYVITFTPVKPFHARVAKAADSPGGRHFDSTFHLLSDKMGAMVHKEKHMFVKQDGWTDCIPGNYEWVKEECDIITLPWECEKAPPSYTMKDRPMTWLKQYEKWDKAWTAPSQWR